MKITFANGVKFAYEKAIETEESYNGQRRRTLTLTCAENAIALDKLNEVLNNEDNTQKITLENEEMGVTHEKEGFVLKIEFGIKSECICEETAEMPAMYENRLVLKLGKRTYIEQALKNLGV